VTDAARARIDFTSRIGVWWASDTWAMPDAQDVAREIEALGSRRPSPGAAHAGRGA
jgi:hypothetical protein